MPSFVPGSAVVTGGTGVLRSRVAADAEATHGQDPRPWDGRQRLRITGVGDCGVDRYVNRGWDRPGGITLNFAATFKRLCAPGDSVCVVSALGTDPEARLVRRAIEALGLEACLAELEGATSIQYVDQQPSGEKLFLRYEEGVLGRYRIGARERELISRSDVLMATVYSQIEGLFDSVMASPSPGLRAVDFGDLAGVTGGLGIVERYLDRFHVGFFGMSRADTDRIEELERIARRSGRLLVATLGADGSLAFEAAHRSACPALAVPRVVDTTGAGDAFAAGFLDEYRRSRRVPESLARGAGAAAEAVQRLGAFPWGQPPEPR
jgi:sugar/nucleoside kinase (ribokinase family)